MLLTCDSPPSSLFSYLFQTQLQQMLVEGCWEPSLKSASVRTPGAPVPAPPAVLGLTSRKNLREAMTQTVITKATPKQRLKHAGCPAEKCGTAPRSGLPELARVSESPRPDGRQLDLGERQVGLQLPKVRGQEDSGPGIPSLLYRMLIYL